MSHIADTIIVALDFDGCVASSEKAKIFHTKRMYGVEVGSSQITKDTYPLGPEKYGEMMDNILIDGIMEFELGTRVKDILNKMYEEGFRFQIVTSRYGTKERPEIDACVYFCEFHELPIEEYYSTGEMPKKDICKEINARAMIDDTLSKLLELVDTPIQLFYIKQPWNAHEKIMKRNKEAIIKVQSWVEFYAQMRSLKTQHEAICKHLNISNNSDNLEQIVDFYKTRPKHAEKLKRDYGP